MVLTQTLFNSRRSILFLTCGLPPTFWTICSWQSTFSNWSLTNPFQNDIYSMYTSISTKQTLHTVHWLNSMWVHWLSSWNYISTWNGVSEKSRTSCEFPHKSFLRVWHVITQTCGTWRNIQWCGRERCRGWGRRFPATS